MILEVHTCVSGFNHDAFYMHICARKAWGNYLWRGQQGVHLDMHSEKKMAYFFVERSHAYQSTRPLLRRQTSTQRLEETRQQVTEGWRRRTGRAPRWCFTVLDPLTAHSTLPAQQRIRAKPCTSQLPSPKQPANIAHAHTHIHTEHNHKTSV